MRCKVNSFGFHFRGKNKQGVSIWYGSVKPLKLIGVLFSVYGPCAGATGLVCLILSLAFPTRFGHLRALAMAGGIHFVLFTSIGQWALRMRRHVDRLSSAEDLGRSLGIDDEGLRRLAEERRIQPRMIFNDEPYYDPELFKDSRVLLRGSAAAPAGPGELLHPARGAGADTQNDLLRAQSRCSGTDALSNAIADRADDDEQERVSQAPGT